MVNDGQLQSVLGSFRPPDLEIRCGGCRRRPHEIPDYADAAEGMSDRPLQGPQDLDEYVRNNEGTYNPVTRRFLCDACYIRAGQPSYSNRAWKCP
jgi:hypothetical protein